MKKPSSVSKLGGRYIKGYGKRYKIFENGEIHSLERYQKGVYGNKRRLMKLSSSIDTSGYRSVMLYKNGVQKRYRLHRLIYTAFVGNIPKGLQINHSDGDKLNNSLENMEIVTAKENVRHAWRIGLCHAYDRKKYA